VCETGNTNIMLSPELKLDIANNNSSNNICEMNPESKKNYLEFGSGLWAYDDFNTEEDDQLWFDTWEGQIELSQDSSSPKKPQSINDLLLKIRQ